MDITIEAVLRSGDTNIDTLTSESYHMRVEVDSESKQIRIPVFDKEDNIQLIVIDGVTPFMGHPKVDGCCE